MIMVLSRTLLRASQSPTTRLLRTMVIPTRKLSQQPGSPPKRMTPSVLELIKDFPAGLKDLYKDVQQYYNISSASFTRVNEWTKRGGLHFIPRRQAEQQRKLIRDLVKVAIPVSIASLPLVGNSIFILCAWKPSLFLSSHFYKRECHRIFVHDEYRNRVGAYEDCAKDFWNTVMTRPSDIQLNLQGRDEAGPIFDALPLYRLFDQFNSAFIPRQQMVNIAKASGMAFPLLWIVPGAFIRYRLNSIAKDIILDDSNLIIENHTKFNCESLTDDEVLDACSLRGLSCDLNQSFDSMRTVLSNYLTMMEPIHKVVGKDTLLGNNDGVMFVLHLQAIRLKMQS
jgi:hypothetical protein